MTITASAIDDEEYSKHSGAEKRMDMLHSAIMHIMAELNRIRNTASKQSKEINNLRLQQRNTLDHNSFYKIYNLGLRNSFEKDEISIKKLMNSLDLEYKEEES